MAATLDDVKKELIDNRKVTDDILKTNKELVSEMTTYFKDLKEQARQAALDQKESNRETEKLIKYKKQVKLVLQKLEDIKFALENAK